MKPHKLLSRIEFKEAVFARDKNKCVFCELDAVDAHHIIERRLFADGGYYLNNGASVCSEHHMLCEQTEISVEDVRLACGITDPVLPDHFYDDQSYDKWGNIVLPNGTRLKGELFEDASVQKVLTGKLDLFVHWVKYPRTYHLPWSQSVNKDDRILPSTGIFHGRRVIVTEKMDGENTSMYSDHFHARSVDSRNHPSRNWVKGIWGRIMGDIPQGWRVCGENLYARHSIAYASLPSYFMGFSIWDNHNRCLSWDETLEWFKLFELTPVPVLFDGIYDEKAIMSLWDNSKHSTSEGYVIRLADSFDYKDFKNSVAKFVRRNHVQTTKHWMHGSPIEKNHLLGDENAF